MVIIIVCVLGLVGIYAATSKKSDKSTDTSTNKAVLSNHVTGKNSKKVTLIEYGDFQCPVCGQFYPLINQVKEKYKDDIQFQFRQFPIQQIHQNARAAARASEAAAKQNKFWEMYDLLYQQQQTWSTSTQATAIFESYAQQISLDEAKYKTDYASTEVNDIINADLSEGTKQGVEGTPTFFLQGKKLNPSPTTVEEFSKVIDEAIKKANQ